MSLNDLEVTPLGKYLYIAPEVDIISIKPSCIIYTSTDEEAEGDDAVINEDPWNI